MNFRYRHILPCVALLSVAVSSCKKAAVEDPQWFRTQTRFYYDLETDSSVAESSRLLTVVALKSGELFFDERPTDTSVQSWSQIFGIFGNGIMKPASDGLYSHASTTCGVGILNTSFDFLSIPARPEAGARIPQYGCAHSAAGYNEIPATDTLLTVPAGRFQTFCVRHENGDRSYWNPEIGIVMYEQWSGDPTLPAVKLLTLKLRRAE